MKELDRARPFMLRVVVLILAITPIVGSICLPSVAYAQTLPAGLPPFAPSGSLVTPMGDSYEVTVRPGPSGGISVDPDPLVIRFPCPQPTYIWFGLDRFLDFEGNYIWWSFPADNPWGYPEGLTYGLLWPIPVGNVWGSGRIVPIPVEPDYKGSVTHGLSFPLGPLAPRGQWKYTVTISDQAGNIIQSLDPTVIISDTIPESPQTPPPVFSVPASTSLSLAILALAAMTLMIWSRRKQKRQSCL